MKKKWLLVLVLLLAAWTPVYVSASSGIFLADTTPSYAHPVTNQIEDSGNNPGIGQGMTESMIGAKALLEFDTDGTIYATARYYLTDQIRDVKIWTQKTGATGWQSVKATVMQQNVNGKYCTDYRFVIPSKDAIVRTSCYVDAMGREVIFYYTFSNPKEGSGDFVKSIQESDTKVNEDNTKTTEDEKQTEEKNQTEDKKQVSDTNPADDVQTEKEVQNSEQKQLTAMEQIEQADGLTTSKEIDSQPEDEVDVGDEKEERRVFSEMFLIVAAAILSGVLVGGILITGIGVGAYFIIKRVKEREN